LKLDVAPKKNKRKKKKKKKKKKKAFCTFEYHLYSSQYQS